MVNIVCEIPCDVATSTSSLNNVEKYSGHARNREVAWENIGPTFGSKKKTKKCDCSTIPTISAMINVIDR